MRPWPRSTVQASTATDSQHSASAAANSLGWFSPIVNTKYASLAAICRAVLALGVHLVGGDHRAGQVLRPGSSPAAARKTGISLVLVLFTGSWAAVVPSSQIPDSSIGARPPRGAAPRSAFPSTRRCFRRPGRCARARAAAQAHSASSYWHWSTAGEDAADRGGVRAACTPGPVPRGAQPEQDLFRRRRYPLPGRVQLVIPGHARRQRQRQQVIQRVHAAPQAAGIIDGIEEPPQPRALAVVPARRPRRPHQLPRRGGRPPGTVARQRRGQRSAPLSRQPGRQPAGSASSGGAAGRNSGTAGTSGITAGSTSGTRARHGTGMADWSMRGSSGNRR